MSNGMCAKCNVHLCEAHFQVYHTKNYERSDDEDEVVKNFSRYKNYLKIFTTAIASSLLIQLGSIRGLSKVIC